MISGVGSSATIDTTIAAASSPPASASLSDSIVFEDVREGCSAEDQVRLWATVQTSKPFVSSSECPATNQSGSRQLPRTMRLVWPRATHRSPVASSCEATADHRAEPLMGLEGSKYGRRSTWIRASSAGTSFRAEMATVAVAGSAQSPRSSIASLTLSSSRTGRVRPT